MEDDRAATNLGPILDPSSEDPPADGPKISRRRFIGRRAAAEKAGQNGASNQHNIEDSGAIQGRQ